MVRLPITARSVRRPELMQIIVMRLHEGDMSWTELWNSVRDRIKSKSTLSYYLRSLREEDMVLRHATPPRARPRYALNRKSHKVRALLGSPSRKQDPYATIELNRFAEEPFIALMCSSTTSQLLNLLRWYVQKGRGRADALAFQGQLLNLLAHIRTFGDYMTARVAEGSFSPRRLAAAIEQADGNVRHEQITLNKATERQPLITNGVPPLKIVLGEMLWKPGTEVRAEDVGLEKLHRISLSRQA